jgi:hypothetical protein
MDNLIKLSQLGFMLCVLAHEENPQLVRFTALRPDGLAFSQEIRPEELVDPVYGTAHFIMAIKNLLTRAKNYLDQNQ